MRLTAVSIATASLFFAVAANAAPGKGDLGGKGGPGPGAGPSGSSESSGSTSDTGSRDYLAPDRVQINKEEPKSWELGATWETHRLIRQEDLGGAAENKTVNVLDAYVFYDITKNDRVTLRGGFYERFIVDNGETGFRLDDTTLQYAHYVPLPQQFTFSVSGRVSAPTSFDSQLAGLITEPRLSLRLTKRIGNFGIDFRTFGTLYVQKYREAQGGNPNPKYAFGGLLEADYRMPFLPDLSIGVDLFNEWIWLYDVQNSGSPNMQFYGATNAQATQPVGQEYGGEIFIRYYMPPVAGMKSDLALALAQGDPSLGYSSVLHDGVEHVYALYRQTAEVYGSLTVRY